MSNQVELANVRIDNYWHFKDMNLLEDGSLIISEHMRSENEQGETVSDDSLICLLPEQVEKLKELLGGLN